MIDEKLIEALGAAEQSERRGAAQEIGESGDPGAVAILLSQLQKEGSRPVKEAILRELSHIWTANPMDSIIVLLKDTDPFVRAEGGNMLERRVNDAMEGLNRLVRNEDKDLRKFGVDMLNQMTSAAPDALYSAALKDADINVVISAVENIGSSRRVAFADRVLDLALKSSQPMAICACMEALALIGTRQTLDALRAKYPDAATVAGIYQQSFMKLLGGIAGPESMDEICRMIAGKRKGIPVYEISIDAMTKIAVRYQLSTLSPFCEQILCGLLQPGLDPGVCFHLIRLLRQFTGSPRVALAVLPYVHNHDPALALAAVESLENSTHPEVETALNSLLANEEFLENDLETGDELRELLRRRPRWNSLQSSSPS
jgi:hypothetical protein